MNRLKIIDNNEISGDTINTIHLISMDKIRSTVLVHTRDNCIRRLNYNADRVVFG